MSITDFLDKSRELDIIEERCVEDNYIELVFSTEDMPKWANMFKEMLGEPVKPEGVNPSKEQQQLTKKYRGIERNQTLFAKSFEDYIIMAMFWPWGNGQYTTLKIVKHVQ